MDIENFFTLQATTTSQSHASDKGKNSALGVSAHDDGTGFVDLILSYMKEIGEAKDQQIKEEKEELKLAKLIADNPEIAEQIENFSIDENTELADVLALNQQAFDDIMKPVELQETITTDLIKTPEGTEEISHVFFIDTEQNHRPVVNKIKAIMDKIERFSDEGSPQFIATNLTPEQITEMQDYLTAIENGEIPEEAPEVGLFVGLVQIIPEQARPDIIVTGQSIIIAPRSLEVSGKTNSGPANDLASTLNNLTPGDGGENFTAALEDIQLAKEAGNQYRSNAAAAGAEEAPAPVNTSTVSSTGFNLDGALTTLIDSDSPLSAQLGLSAASANPASAAVVTNPVTQSYSAGTTHPATQLVNNALQKAAQNGQNADITLRLDPPELGRIQARLQFGSSNALRTTLMVEQPETFAMLQRDVHSLERALQDVGLDLSDGINLELAEQGFDFDQNANQRGGGHDSGGTGAGGEQTTEQEIIETTMTWHLDPETGHTHYNIWA